MALTSANTGRNSNRDGVGPLRVAIVGAGKMARHHATAVGGAGVPAKVTAIVDPDTAVAERLAASFPGATAWSSLESLLASDRPDVVHVCSPPATHAEMARAALNAGCHVYVEKPFTDTAAAAGEVLALAASRGLQVCSGHQLLFEPPAVVLRENLPCLGRVVHLESFFSFRPVRRSPDGRTPLRADLQLLDILPHPVYLLLNFLELVTGQPSPSVSIQEGPGGTVHALVRSGEITGSLVVTLQGRPVESFLRVTGTNGTMHADFVRSTVQRLFGPGSSGIEKVLEPYRLALQMTLGTTRALARRIARRQLSYPGLAELFGAFYRCIRDGAPPPLSPASILGTVRVCEEIAKSLDRSGARAEGEPRREGARGVAVTGGTGFLGRETVRALVARNLSVRVLARRLPAPWDREDGAEYDVADLGRPLPEGVIRPGDIVIHAAAETAGGWDEHRRNSVEATTNLLRAAAAAGAAGFVHVSSLAVLGSGRGRAPLSETSPLVAPSEPYGPYVWGKAESEKAAMAAAGELGLPVKIVRPGPIVDYREFESPGRLGRRIGPFFVAAGWPRDRIGIVDVEFAGRFLAFTAERFAEAPEVCHLLSPELPTRRELLRRLKASNPDLRVIWLPRPILVPLSWLAMGLQKLLRPRKPAMNVAAAFATVPYDTSLIAERAKAMR